MKSEKRKEMILERTPLVILLQTLLCCMNKRKKNKKVITHLKEGLLSKGLTIMMLGLIKCSHKTAVFKQGLF